MSSPEPRWPSAQVPSLARTLADPHFSNGERAALKRMGLDGPAPLALHRFILSRVDESWQDERWTDRWRTLICALAIQRDGGFDPSRPWGQALAEAHGAAVSGPGGGGVPARRHHPGFPPPRLAASSTQAPTSAY